MPFAGFDRSAPQFFHELAIEMNREWYEANKDRYRTQWVEPMTALLEEARTKLGRAYGATRLGAPKLFRLHRDVRFAKDKTPYKTHIAGHIPLGTKKPVDGGATALYLELGVDGEWAGAGMYFFDPAQIVRWRKRIIADASGRPLVRLVESLRKRGLDVGGHDDYKRVPRGLPADHVRADYLKMRGLTAGFPELPRGIVHSRKLVDWLVEKAAAAAPMVQWLHRL